MKFWGFGVLVRTHLLFECDSIEGDDASEDGVENEGGVGEELVGGERRNGVQEQIRSFPELACGEKEQTLVDLQTVLALPVPPLLEQTGGQKTANTVCCEGGRF